MIKYLHGHSIVTYNKLIKVQSQLRRKVLRWYHHFLQHPGGVWLYETIHRALNWPRVQLEFTECVKRCTTHQSSKILRRKYGETQRISPFFVGARNVINTSLLVINYYFDFCASINQNKQIVATMKNSNKIRPFPNKDDTSQDRGLHRTIGPMDQ